VALDRRTISKEPSRSAGALSADESAPRLAPILTGPFGKTKPKSCSKSSSLAPSAGGVLLILFPLDGAKAPVGDKPSAGQSARPGSAVEAEGTDVPE
jgi:hypothetical protein